MYTERDKLQAAEDAIVAAITKNAPSASNAQLLMLAEAYAWLLYPNNSHGGGDQPT